MGPFLVAAVGKRTADLVIDEVMGLDDGGDVRTLMDEVTYFRGRN